MPRTVPFSAETEVFCCTKVESNPCVSNSDLHIDRAKKPRSSPRFSKSMIQASLRVVEVKIMKRLQFFKGECGAGANIASCSA